MTEPSSNPPTSPWQRGHDAQPYLVSPSTTTSLEPLPGPEAALPPAALPPAAQAPPFGQVSPFGQAPPAQAPPGPVGSIQRRWLITALSLVIVAALAAFAGADVYLAGRHPLTGPKTTALSSPTAVPVVDGNSPFKLPISVDDLPQAPAGGAAQTMLKGLARSLADNQLLTGSPAIGLYQGGGAIAILMGLPIAVPDSKGMTDAIFEGVSGAGMYKIENRKSYPSASTGGVLQCANTILDAGSGSGINVAICVNADDIGTEILFRSTKSGAATAAIMRALLPDFESR